MCGRLDLSHSPAIGAFLERHNLPLFPASYNTAPTENVPSIIHTASGIDMHMMRWWLTPSWAPEPTQKFPMFNARAEGVATSKAFKTPFAKRRCLIPVSGYYEWKSEGPKKTPYRISAISSPLLLAGIWEVWERGGVYLESCAILTTDSVQEMAWLHTRQPVMIPEVMLQEWINPLTPADIIGQFLLPHLPVELEATPVDSAVGNARYKGPVITTGAPIPIKT